MTDNRLDEALDVVARHVIARAVREGTDDFYDEISEGHWQAICVRLKDLTPYPDQAQYQAAYDYLTQRAEGEA